MTISTAIADTFQAVTPTGAAVTTSAPQGTARVGAGIQTNGILQNAGKLSDGARQAKLAEAAQKFEGMMLEELLKPMQKAGSAMGGSLTGDDDADGGGDSSMDNLDSYGVEAMAEALAKGGGFGLAKQVLRQIGNLDERSREKS